MNAEPAERSAARVLLLDAKDRLLLFHGFDPHDRARGGWWITPGGGLEPGEDPTVGAARELFEETGLLLDPAEFVGPVYERVAEFPFEGRRYRQAEGFYLARVAAWDVDTSGFTAVELRSVDGHRWWSLAELRTTTEQVYPECLSDLLTSALSWAEEA